MVNKTIKSHFKAYPCKWQIARNNLNKFRTCLDTLTFDLILVKLDQKQEFLIHEKLCTPL
ncbi:hypothetical protein ASV54_17525 (plasmid) [Lactiplantibacillus plantarum]|nr:hypothetical protein ASV54_17525 [Lactiplantibacillus plantarum]